MANGGGSSGMRGPSGQGGQGQYMGGMMAAGGGAVMMNGSMRGDLDNGMFQVGG